MPRSQKLPRRDSLNGGGHVDLLHVIVVFAIPVCFIIGYLLAKSLLS